MIELRQADGRLHVGDLQIEAEMRVDVLVVVAARQVAELPVEAALARVVLARIAIAVAPPVADRFHRRAPRRVAREHGAALAHGDVVRRIEAQRADVTERADMAAADRGAHGVAAVLDEKQLVLLGDLREPHGVERIASVCATMMARVRSVIAASTRSGTMCRWGCRRIPAPCHTATPG